MRKFIDCINDNTKKLSQCVVESGDVIFSGIGTYFIEITVGLIIFIPAFFLIKRKHNSNVVDNSTNIKQGGFFNKMNLKFWNRYK